MPAKLIKAFSDFIDWFHNLHILKKIYTLITIMAIGLFFLLKYYAQQIDTINAVHNNRIDSITLFYNNKLSECNSENKDKYAKILEILYISLEEQKKLQIESEKIKLESERIKSKMK